MKICLLTHTYPPSLGGVSSSVKRMTRLLFEAGYSVIVSAITSKLLPGQEAFSEEKGVFISRMGKYPSASDTRSFWFYNLCKLIDEHNISLIHSYYVSRAGFVGTMAASLRGLPSIVSVRGNDLEKDIFSCKEFSFIEWTLKKCNVITCVSAQLAEIASLFTCKDKIKVIHNSVDSEFFRKLPRDKKMENLFVPEAPVIGFIGEGKIKKGIFMLLKAFEIILDKTDVHLLMIGNIRKEMGDLIKFFKEKNKKLERFLHVFPPVLPENMIKFYNLMDLLVIPSLRDGMPNVLLEAMACEVPVVATNAGAMPEVIIDGETGLMVNPGDFKNLSAEILRLIDREDLRLKFGRAGRERVKKEFHSLRELEKNMEIYKNILSKGVLK